MTKKTIDATQDVDTKPPRFMVVLADFKTDTQRQIGAVELADLFTLNKKGKKTESSDFMSFVEYFEELVKDAEKDPWAVKVKKTKEVEVVTPPAGE